MENKLFINKLIKDNAWVEIDNQNQQVIFKGNLRLSTENVAPGDYVDISFDNGQYIINKILARKNFLLRPKVANVDKAIIIQSTIEPEFNTLLIDKMICFYTTRNINVAIAISKLDLIDVHNKINQFIDWYKKMGYEIYSLNNESDFKQMVDSFSEKIICFVGNSGVGKSTLINRISPKLNLLTQETSKALNRGKHTTTNTSIIKINNFFLVDTPGFATINLDKDKFLLAKNFFKKILNNNYCKFNDCLHFKENECLVKQLLNNQRIPQWHYNNYLNLLKKMEQQ